MEKELSIIQLQGMLREMGVKFSAKESLEDLVKLLKAENHKKWLGVDEEGNVSKDKVVIKRRAKKKDLVITPDTDETIIIESSKTFSENREISSKRDFKKPDTKIEILSEHVKNVRNVANYNKASRNVQKLVMRRANGSCELCCGNGELAQHHILSLEDGGEDTVKNVVALCEKCVANKEFSKSDIKVMKRNARSRISKDITVVYKKP